MEISFGCAGEIVGRKSGEMFVLWWVSTRGERGLEFLDRYSLPFYYNLIASQKFSFLNY
jgi:hypothetical protein